MSIIIALMSATAIVVLAHHHPELVEGYFSTFIKLGEILHALHQPFVIGLLALNQEEDLLHCDSAITVNIKEVKGKAELQV